MKKLLVLAALAAVVIMGFGCAGYTPQVSLPTYIQKLAVPLYVNKTQTYNIEQYVTQKTIDEFISDGKVSIADEQSADGVLKVNIEKYLLTPITFDINQVPQQYRLRIYVSVYLFDNKNQRQLWTEPDIWEETTYYVVNNLGMPAETEEIARVRVLDRLADRVFRRTMNGW
jgi:hypothetical protein